MSQTKLGERMAELGCEWSRTSVAKLEGGHRNSVSVQELLALAVVFDVAPVMLLADPRHGERVPIADGLDIDPWTALLWLMGFTTLTNGEPTYQLADDLVYEGALLVDKIDALDTKVFFGQNILDERARKATAEMHVRALAALAAAMSNILAAGASLPRLPDFVLEMAKEHGINLPGQGG